MPEPHLMHHEFTDLDHDRAQVLAAFAARIGVSAVVTEDPRVPDAEQTYSVGVAFQDGRSLRRLELLIERGFTDEPRDPVDPFVSSLAGRTAWPLTPAQRADLAALAPGADPATPNLDLETSGEARRWTGNLEVAERAARAANLAAKDLRDLAGNFPTLAWRDEAGQVARFCPPPALADLVGSGWTSRLLDLAAVCDLIEIQAGRVAAEADTALHELPAHLRPTRHLDEVLARVDGVLAGQSIDAARNPAPL